MKPSHLAPVEDTSPADEFSAKQVAGCTVVTVATDLDIATVGAFTELVAEAVAMSLPVIIDLSACAYSDSTGLRAIAVAHAGFPPGSGIVVAAKGTVRRLFAITGFDAALAPFPTLAEALRSATTATGSNAYG